MLYCPNGSCPARIYWGLVHFVSQDAMDIRGLGERTAAQLLEKGLVTDYADLYHVTEVDLLNWTVSARCRHAISSLPSLRRGSCRCPGCCSRWASATSASMRRRCWRASSARWTRLLAPTRPTSLPYTALAAPRPMRWPRSWRSPGTASSSQRLRDAGVRMDEPVEGRALHAGRPYIRHHGHPRHEPQGSHGSSSSGMAAGWRAAYRATRATSSPARAPAPSWTAPANWAWRDR
jgi:hypothetical protein